MAEENRNSVTEQLQKGAQAAGAVKSAVKTGKAIAAAAKGAAAGGPFGAAAGFVLQNRKLIAKLAIALVAFLLLPVLFICMLPSLVFGGLGNEYSPSDPDTPILNSDTALTANMTSASDAISRVLSDGMSELLEQIDRDYAASGAERKEIINPYENSPSFNANRFISQYCASKNEDFSAVSLEDMNSILKSGKDELYSYERVLQQRTVKKEVVTIDPTTEKEVKTEISETKLWASYTVKYNGEMYFADRIFHLNDEQKQLAENYAQNLSLFLGDSMFQCLPDGYSASPSLGDIRFTDGQIPVVYYNQVDERYSDQPYGTDKIGSCGCGPTAMAIVVSSLTDSTVDPVTMAEWSYKNGYWCSGSGSYHDLIPEAAKAWKLPVEGCGKNNGQMIADALSKGKLVVALMVKGHFTKTGHFIVLRGVRNGKILVADPVSYARSEQEWDLSVILSEASPNAGAGGPFWIIG